MKNKLLFLLSFVLVINGYASEKYEIKLKSGSFVPQKLLLNEKISFYSDEATTNAVYRVIQFYALPSSEDKEILAQNGIKLLEYIPNNAFVARLPKEKTTNELMSLGVRSVFRLNGDQKTVKSLKSSKLPVWAVKGNKISLNITTYEPSNYNTLITFLSAIGGEVLLAEGKKYNYITALVDVDAIDKIANYALVKYISPIDPPAEKEDDEGRSLHRANAVSNSFANGRNYDGTGVTVALADDGAIGPHIDFQGRLTNTNVPSSGDHGDMTSGILCGAGNIDPTIKGMAPGAYLMYYDIGGYTHIYNAVSNLSIDGTVLTSTSYSQSSGGEYSSSTQAVDQQLHQNTELIHIFSAGNAGTSNHGYGGGAGVSGWGNITGGIKAGKNVIACGNLNQYDVLWASSSRGPAEDGRIKPDICAYGNNQLSTGEDNTYQTGGGTSAAAPGISGITTQLYHAYRENNGGANPEGGLIKACMLNAAEDIGNPGPDFKHGWGRVNALKAARIIEDSTYFFDNISNGTKDTHTITVPNNVGQLKVMTYWTDVEGSTIAAQALVNDINMQVVDPSSTSYNPWVLDPTPNPTNLNTPAVRGIDFLNNVEQVTIDNPAAGTYQVVVDGYAIPQGPQNYYVVYDFIYDDVELTYPIGGEGFVPGEMEVVRWDAYGDVGNFILEYSTTNGATWNTISTSIPGTDRYYNWVVPSVLTGAAQLRISRNGKSDVSDKNFSIVGVPSYVKVESVCPDSIELDWPGVTGINEYVVYMLGDKYMEPIDTVSTSFAFISGLDHNQEHWFSVSALNQSLKIRGRRAYAVRQNPGLFNCVFSNNIELSQVVSPVATEVPNCLGMDSTAIVVEVTNVGSNNISNIDLSYQVNGGTIQTEGFNLNLSPSGSTTVTFATAADLSVAGNYEIKIFSSWTSDQEPLNDTLVTILDVVDVQKMTLPYRQNFDAFTSCVTSNTCGTEICELDSGWTNITNGIYDDINWRIDQDGTPSNNTGPDVDFTKGTSSGKYIYVEVPAICTNQKAELLTPCLDLTNATEADLEFAVHMYGASMGDLHFDVMKRNGVVDLDVAPPFTTQMANEWVDTAVDLSNYIGEVIVFKFRAISGSGPYSDIALDGIKIGKEDTIPDSNVAINEWLLNGLQVVPNPTKGVLNVNISQESLHLIESVSLLNVLGQEELTVSQSQINANFQLNLTDLPSGVHYLTIKTNQGLIVKKIVKE